ncbi:MAG: aminotransferase class V-fold PLP-dependent enzyme, partial [Proteobacteria bacterium]|nr:aminotransferase class V-fold PLP-dependent enzyme [Pseudomonadota bacterium]
MRRLPHQRASYPGRPRPARPLLRGHKPHPWRCIIECMRSLRNALAGSTLAVAAVFTTGCESLLFGFANRGLEPPETTVAYAPELGLSLDVYRPPRAGAGTSPVVVFFYGGGWQRGERGQYPVGVSVVIVRRELLERAGQPRAEIFNYAAHVRGESMLNTPPTWNWYLAGLVFKWMLAEGGVTEFARRNARKSKLLYDVIDGSGGFYRNEVAVAVRSRMNVPFFLCDDALDKPFLAEAKEAGLISLKGHRALGGMRASIAMADDVEPVPGVMPVKTVATVIGVLAIAYALASAWLAWRQRDLIYYPQYTRVPASETDFALERGDAMLRGWRVNPGQRDAIVYFGGNAESIETMAPWLAAWFPDRTSYLLAYRGYGASDGRPSETALTR